MYDEKTSQELINFYIDTKNNGIQIEKELLEKFPEMKNILEQLVNEIIKVTENENNELKNLIFEHIDNFNEIGTIKEEINRLQNIANTKTKKKIKSFLDNEMTDNIKGLIIELRKFKAEIESEITGNIIPDILQVSQNHNTNALKGAFPNLEKNRLEKDENYTQEVRQHYYVLTYMTTSGEKKNYKTKIAINDLPSVKLPMNDIVFSKFFTFIHYQYNKQGSYLFSFNTREFLAFLGKEPTPDIIKKINAKINKFCKNVLPFIQLRWSKGAYDSEQITPFAGAGIKKGIVKISFEVSYADSIKNSYYNLPSGVGKLSEHAYLMADYIYTYARSAKKDEFTLTFGTLYKKTGLPSYDEVINNKNYNGNTNRTIKEPIYKALQEIKNIIGVPEKYLNNKGEINFNLVPSGKADYKIIIKENELTSEKWEDFIKSKISFKIIGYKQQCAEMIQLRDKKIKQKSKKDKGTQ
jgi:hypothetical protein